MLNEPEPVALLPTPKPPKSQRLPLLPVQLTAESRDPGMFPAAGVPNAVLTPGVLGLLVTVQVHSFVERLNIQRSLRTPSILTTVPTLPAWPPKSQKLPLLSVQLTVSSRPPGMFPAAGTPNVPYTPPDLHTVV